MIENAKSMKRILTKLPGLIVFGVLLLCRNQDICSQTGSIHWKDGTVTKIDSISEISVELVYYWWNRHGLSHNSEGYYKTFPVSALKEIKFVMQRSQGAAGFYYRVMIRGYDGTGERFEEKIPAWDWIDMSVPGDNDQNKSRVTFFHQKRRIRIERIEFGD